VPLEIALLTHKSPGYIYDLVKFYPDSVPAGATLDGTGKAVASVVETYNGLNTTSADGLKIVEELYGVEELATGDGRVDPQAVHQRREARLLADMLKAGDAVLLYSGVAVNLLALRPEICTVLIVDDARWYERECGQLRICDEFLQQSQQAELLPDQRWVQLINLERHDLELDARWRDQLHARTVVAPGVAAIDLGLQVAQTVAS